MSREADILETIKEGLNRRNNNYPQPTREKALDRLIQGNLTHSAEHIGNLSHYRRHYLSEDDVPDVRGHVHVLSASYRRAFQYAETRSLQQPRFCQDRVSTREGWLKVERSYVRSVLLSHRSWDRLNDALLQEIEDRQLCVINDVFVLGGSNGDYHFSFDKKGRLFSYGHASNINFQDPTIAIIHEKNSDSVLKAFSHFENTKTRRDLMRHVLVRWAWPKYHAKEETDVIDAIGIPLTVISVPATPDCPINRAYVMEGNSYEVKFPVFWPDGSLNVVD